MKSRIILLCAIVTPFVLSYCAPIKHTYSAAEAHHIQNTKPSNTGYLYYAGSSDRHHYFDRYPHPIAPIFPGGDWLETFKVPRSEIQIGGDIYFSRKDQSSYFQVVAVKIKPNPYRAIPAPHMAPFFKARADD